MSRLATPEGTKRYAERLGALCAPTHFRRWPEPASGENEQLSISSIGLGSYTGPADRETDGQYQEAVREAVVRGINLLDCAINYRHMRSERALGEGLRALFASGEASRDEILVMTKGGYLSFEGEVPSNVAEYYTKTYLETGIVRRSEVVAGSHCIAPRFLENQLERSLANFGLEGCDVYFLHNVEQQLDEVAPDEFYGRVRAAFEFLESATADGRIGRYGVATWNGFRVPPDSRGHLSLARLWETAVSVAGENHHFQALQLPFNLGMPEVLVTPTQPLQGKLVSLLEAASAYGLMVVTSVPLLQSQLLSHVPPAFADQMPGLTTDAQRAIQFVRSAPGVLAPLVGMRQAAHVRENALLARVPPLEAAQFYKLLGG
jgi:aryl-alcohol dehydrogenase-like predicted oxidoreductase